MQKLLLVLLCLSPLLVSFKFAPTCLDAPQAGVEIVTIENGQEIYTFDFPQEFCTAPIVVVSGDEMIEVVHIGVITRHVASVTIEGLDGEARLYWHALPPTP